jgi:SsrA-binding protein
MVLLVNKKASFEYEILEKFQAGVVLSGAEVKSVRHKSGSLSGSFVKILGDEAFLLNAQISPYKYADNREYDPKRTRKLLLKKKEIYQLLESSAQKGRTLVPLSFEAVGRTIKLNFGIGRGKKVFEKRAQIKERDIARDMARELKS